MPSCLAFFPWLVVREPVTVGDVRLIPYRRGVAPGNTETVTQQDIDAILAAYSLRKDNPVGRATLLEVGAWRNGQDATPEVASDLFRVRELLAFSAMAERRLFRREGYSNYPTFALTVQRYAAGQAGAFSFSVRRLDGGTNHLWDAEEFAFLKPLHVEAGARLEFDQDLFQGLLRADAVDQLEYAAIQEFNVANTDSLDIPQHLEIVMAKSAFEFLLGIDQHWESFVGALLPFVPTFAPNEEFPCPEFTRWSQRFQRATRPLEAWAREFCVRRNEAGHGIRRGAAPHVWSEDAHLAFASVLFPSLVRLKLVQQGFLTLSELQQVEVDWLEAHLGFDPFAPRVGATKYQPHDWEKIRSDGVAGELYSRHMREALKDLDLLADMPKENET
jgi:hypothetical protein